MNDLVVKHNKTKVLTFSRKKRRTKVGLHINQVHPREYLKLKKLVHFSIENCNFTVTSISSQRPLCRASQYSVVYRKVSSSHRLSDSGVPFEVDLLSMPCLFRTESISVIPTFLSAFTISSVLASTMIILVAADSKRSWDVTPIC